MKNIVIYQPSKVGSMTVAEYVSKHYNLPDKTRNVKGKTVAQNVRIWKDSETTVYHTHHINWLPSDIRGSILNDDEIVYYVCMTREPIARNISGFFEWFGHQTPEFFNTKSIEYYIEEFINKYQHMGGIEWFDTEFLTVGFDLYSKVFNTNKGYQIYEKGNKKLLFIRTEDLNTKLKEGLSELLNEDFGGEIVRHYNTSTTVNEERSYHSVYEKFKKEIKIPKEILDKVYRTKHIKFFYTEEEIKNFYDKWG